MIVFQRHVLAYVPDSGVDSHEVGITSSLHTQHPFILPIVANELETTCPSKTPAFPLRACRFTYCERGIVLDELPPSER